MAAEVVLEVRFPESLYDLLRAEGADEALLRREAQEGLAVRLYLERRLSLAEAAELAALPPTRFLELLHQQDGSSARSGAGLTETAPSTELSTSSSSAAILSMTTTLRRLGELMAADEYDAEFEKPSLASYEFAWNTLAETIPRLTTKVPLASPAAVGDGGIFIQWGSQERYVRLLIPAEPSQAYLYCKAESETRTIREVDSVRLVQALQWLALR